jgi:pimeloyl-ACP methyl ester carboxylesterase
MKLIYRQSGEGRPLIILHGLFGSSDNWYSLSKVFATQFNVFVVDQRNHGQSPQSDEFNYALLTEDLHDFINEHELSAPIIIGHSMGGKAAMNFAVRYPTELSNLIVVDMVPKAYPIHHDAILKGLKSIDLEHLNGRSAADELLSEFVPESDVRQFLLKNLARKSTGGFEWRINLKAIDQHIEALGADLLYSGKYDGPALFIKGKKSHYYADGDEARILSIFPGAGFAEMNTGHWVQAEKPEEFAQVVLNYLNA